MNPVHRRLNAFSAGGFARGMQDAVENHTRTAVRLSYDGRTHVVRNAAATWEMRLELEQLGAGEIIGVGSIATALDAPHDGLVAEVIVGGRVDHEGTARLHLTPIAAGSTATVTVVLRLAEGHGDRDPVVDAVVSVEGLPV
jgi:hypothetical protein